MLQSAAPVLKEILKSHPKGGADLETISKIVTGVTHIDEVRFIEYEASPNNPVIGAFRKFQVRKQPYTAETSIVEIRYAAHLDDTLRRYVVCKELCHSLEATQGTHAVSDDAVDALVAAFSQMSEGDQPLQGHEFSIELLAISSAIEIICPLPRRMHLISKYGIGLDHELVVTDYGFPDTATTKMAFGDSYVATMKYLYTSFGVS